MPALRELRTAATSETKESPDELPADPTCRPSGSVPGRESPRNRSNLLTWPSDGRSYAAWGAGRYRRPVLDLMLLAGGLILVVVVPLAVAWQVRRHRQDLGTATDRTTFATLHTAGLAAAALRTGLRRETAEQAIRHLHPLLDAPSLALVDSQGTLAWDGEGTQHLSQTPALAAAVLASGRVDVRGPAEFRCLDPQCQLRWAVIAPLAVDDRVVGALVAFAPNSSAGLVRATTEVAAYVSAQLGLAELDASRVRLAEAEVRALRAQISPHFVYNALTAIASNVRTDPEHARELLLEFAEFTRYSFHRHGEFTTLAEELHSIDAYLALERARFGERLQVVIRVAPEVLAVTVPFLCLQPLVENAIRHGLEGKPGVGHVTILAEDAGTECLLSVEDDGVGVDPEQMRAVLAGESEGDSVGVGNVDERLRTVFGDEYGLVVETAIGAGTKVSMRVPKFRLGVHA
jgi:two-component system LytT family sensor kinase